MAEQAEKLLAVFEARFTNLEKAFAKASGDASKTFKGIERAGTQAEQTLSRIGPRAAQGLTTFNRSIGDTRSRVQSLSFQFNDFFTQVSSGTSVMQALSQQSGQAIQSLSGVGGAMAALRLAGQAFLNPISLATLGVTALAYAASKYFADTSESAEDANKKLQEHRKLIQEAISAWGDAPPKELVLYNMELEKLDKQAAQRAGLQEFVTKKLEPIRTGLDEATVAFEDFYRQFSGFDDLQGYGVDKLKADFDRMSKAIQGGNAEVTDLLPLFTRLQEVEAQFGQVPGFEALRSKIQALLPILESMNKELETTRQTLNNIGSIKVDLLDDANRYTRTNPDRPTLMLPNETNAPARLGVDDIFPGNIRTTEPKAFLKTRAVSDRIANRIDEIDDNFAEGLSKVLAQFPELRVVSAKRTTAEQKAIYDSGIRPAARPGGSLHESGRAVDLGLVGGGEPSRAFLDRLYGAARQAGVEFPVRGDPFHAQQAGAQSTATIDAQTKSVKSLADAWDNMRYKTSEAKSVVEAQEAAYSRLNNVAQTALDGIANALADGKIEGKELLKIALDIAKAFLTMPVPGVGSAGLGGGIGGGSILGGIFKLFGFAGGGIASRGRPVRGFSSGGIARSASVFGEAGPEAAVPLPDGRQIPVDLRMPGGATGGPAGGLIELRVKGEPGPMFDAHVEAVSTTTSVRVTKQGIKQYDKKQAPQTAVRSVKEYQERSAR